MSDCRELTVDSGGPDPDRLRAKHVIECECITSPDPQLGLGAVARQRTCQADGSSDGFCQGWQLANENSVFFFWLDTHRIYVSVSLR